MTAFPKALRSQKLVMNEAVQYLQKIRYLTVAGAEVDDQFFSNLQPHIRLRSLGITDFERVTVTGLSMAIRTHAPIKSIARLAIICRNGGVSPDGRRNAVGWLNDARALKPLIHVLNRTSIHVGTAWESGQAHTHTMQLLSHWTDPDFFLVQLSSLMRPYNLTLEKQTLPHRRHL